MRWERRVEEEMLSDVGIERWISSVRITCFKKGTFFIFKTASCRDVRSYVSSHVKLGPNPHLT